MVVETLRQRGVLTEETGEAVRELRETMAAGIEGVQEVLMEGWCWLIGKYWTHGPRMFRLQAMQA